MGRTKKGVTPPVVASPAPNLTPKTLKVNHKTPLSGEEPVEVSRIKKRPNVQTGRPKPIPKNGNVKLAYTSSGVSNGNVANASGGNFYSPELSTDFLQLPQSRYEQWNYYRFFARKHPFVKQALKLHTELPLSKIRLNMPKAKDRDVAMAATNFCEAWCKRVDLLRRLMAIVHDYHLIGTVNVFIEDNNPDMPDELIWEEQATLGADGEIYVERIRKKDQSAAVKWLKKNYKGWTGITVLPPEQVHSSSFSFTREKILELVLDSKTKSVVQSAEAGDPKSIRIVKSMPKDIVEAAISGTNIPLNTDPDAGSFVYVMEADKADYEEFGQSMLESCLQTLVQSDKIRQANASIASRHMTPIRVIWAENLSAGDMNDLRDQVDLALQDPDFSIITNYQLNWEEMGSEQRLLDLTSEVELTNRHLYAGLGVTESLLTGESDYSGSRVNLETINTRYMLLRELLIDFVEEFLFKPMCRRMGFVEEDEDGEEVVIYPKMTFTRLGLRDTQETWTALWDLYSKGSVDVDTILELQGLDPVATREKIERDLFTVNDPLFNEVIRGLYSGVGSKLVEESDALDKIVKTLRLQHIPPKEGGGRF